MSDVNTFLFKMTITIFNNIKLFKAYQTINKDYFRWYKVLSDCKKHRECKIKEVTKFKLYISGAIVNI